MGKAAIKNDLLLPDEIIEEGAVQNPMRPFQQIFSQLVIKEFLPNSLSFNPHKFVQVVTEFYNSIKVKIKLFSIQKSLIVSTFHIRLHFSHITQQKTELVITLV